MTRLHDILCYENKTFNVFHTRYKTVFETLYSGFYKEGEIDFFINYLNKMFISLYGGKQVSSFVYCELQSCKIEEITPETDLTDIYNFLADLMYMKSNTLEKMKAVMLKDIDFLDTKIERIEELIVSEGTNTGTSTQEIESNTYGYNTDTPVKDSGESNNDTHNTTTTGNTTKTVTHKGNTTGKTYNELQSMELERLQNEFIHLTLQVYGDMFTNRVY